MSRDSKPAARLDWIVNDKLNLSATNLFRAGPSAGPIFSVKQRRHVRLPAAGQEARPGASEAAPLALELLQSQSQSQFQAAAESAPFLLLAGRQSNGSLANQHQHQQRPISLTRKALDQLAEFASSTLTFSVSPDLVRALAERGSGAARTLSKRHTHLEPEPRLGAPSLASKSQGRLAEPATKWRHVARLASQQHSSPNWEQPRMVLKINCVAQVMHLSMSAATKLKLVNKTRESWPRSGPAESLAGQAQSAAASVGPSSAASGECPARARLSNAIDWKTFGS